MTTRHPITGLLLVAVATGAACGDIVVLSKDGEDDGALEDASTPPDDAGTGDADSSADAGGLEPDVQVVGDTPVPDPDPGPDGDGDGGGPDGDDAEVVEDGGDGGDTEVTDDGGDGDAGDDGGDGGDGDTGDVDGGVEGCEADPTACDDGDLCNGSESCVDDVCVPGTPPDCDDGEVCTKEGCDPALGCTSEALPNGAPCGDDDLCNGADLCQSGSCVTGAPPDCGESGPCKLVSCSPSKGCQSDLVADGTGCSDGNACNGVETCKAGTCAKGKAPLCDDGNECSTDVCEPASGCVNLKFEDGAPCGDGDPCNGSETCQKGFCASGKPPVCDDGNPCTSDACVAGTGCASTPIEDGAPCQDADLCNGDEVCDGGECLAGTPLDCNDLNPCTEDTCHAAQGCLAAPLEDGTDCADDDVCDGTEACDGGECVVAIPGECDDGDPCTIDLCDVGLGCDHVVAEDGTGCPDGDLCNGGETCESGGCVAGLPPDCDDGEACTTDGCDAETGCTAEALPDETSCADGDKCDGVETCIEGTCAAGPPLVCNDGNPCTQDFCLPETGCGAQNAVTGTPCPDGNLCDGKEVCVTGVCKKQAPLKCDDGNACTGTDCEATKGCTFPVFADDVSCSDGNKCNGGEICKGGTCQKSSPPLECDDENLCTIDACAPGTGCTATPVDNGTSCGDDDACTGVETCTAGQCFATAAVDCDDGNACTADSCLPETGDCVHDDAVLDGAGCDDGDPCTSDDACDGGVCTSGNVASFLWPVAGVEGVDWTVRNYVDSDPGPGLADYTGAKGSAARTEQGHTGIDIDLPTFRHMDADWPVLAAESGVVTEVVDGNYDRNVTCGVGAPNHVRIQHPGGLDTIYLHLKQGSVAVAVGQTVAKGDVVGVAGSSGCSTGPHLHFEVRDCGEAVVDPIAEGLVLAPPVYAPPLTVMDFVLADGSMFAQIHVLDPQPNLQTALPFQQVAFALSLAGGGPGDKVSIVVKRPNGTIFDTMNVILTTPSIHTYHWWDHFLDGSTGTWTAEIYEGETLVRTHVFEVAQYAQIVRHAIPETYYQNVQDALAGQALHPTWLDAYDLHEAPFLDVVFDASPSGAWWAFQGHKPAVIDSIMADFQPEFQPRVFDSYRTRGEIRYLVVFYESTTEWTWYRSLLVPDHEVTFAQLASEGFRLATVSQVQQAPESGGFVEVSAVYDKVDVGEWKAEIDLTESELVALLGDLVQTQGYTPSLLNAYTKDGSPLFQAIFDHQPASSTFTWHSLEGPDLDPLASAYASDGFHMRALTGYRKGSKPRFGAIWWK